MAFPQNEKETIALFKLAQHQLGWRIVHLQTCFPDAVIENGEGKRLIIEFEYKAKNFQAHGHHPAGCELIIAYENDWPNSPVPIWELKNCTREIISIIRTINGKSVPFQEYVELCLESAKLEKEIRALKTQLEQPKIESPIELEQASEQDWITAFGYFVLGIGFWAILPLALNLLTSL